jgi:nitrogen regulatory protein P-II 1
LARAETAAAKDNEREFAMKIVVGYVETEVVEPIRAELLAGGVLSLSVVAAKGSVPEPTVTGSYRGATMEQHLRPKARLECVVGDEQAETVVDTVSKYGGDRYFVFVTSIDSASPTGTVNLEPAAQEA